MVAKGKKQKKESQERNKVQVMIIRVPIELHDKLREAAFKNNEKMNAIIVRILSKHLNLKK